MVPKTESLENQEVCADGRAQTSAKKKIFPLIAAMIRHHSDNFLQAIMMGKHWFNHYDFKTI
jgi:hypothetical protein